MKNAIRALAVILALSPAIASAQQFPTVPDHSAIGRIGAVGQSGPSQAIPFATLTANLLNGLCTTSGAFPIYNATSARWVCSTVGGTGSIAAITGTFGSVQILNGNVLNFTRNGDNYITANSGSSSALHLQNNNVNILDINASSIGANASLNVTVPSGLNTGLNVFQNPTGTSSGANCPSGLPGGSFCANVISLGASAINNMSVPNGQGIFGLVLYDEFGQGIGGHSPLWAFGQLSQPTSASNTSNRNYSAGQFTFNAASGDGGTNTGAGSLGAAFGVAIQASTSSAATNLLEVAGGEVNLLVGSSPNIKAYWTLVVSV